MYNSQQLIVTFDDLDDDFLVREIGPLRGDDAPVLVYLPADNDAREEAVDYLVAAYNACRKAGLTVDDLAAGKLTKDTTDER
jgi:hypothetical protein